MGCSRLPLVRECGAVVGDHSSARSYSWVQPCHRDDREGCEERCRRARSLCEADHAAYRDKALWFGGPPYNVPEAEATRNLEQLNGLMDLDCPR